MLRHKWILFTAALFITHSCFALDTITLQLNGPHGYQFAGYYAAKELGFYEEAGLDVNLEETAPNSVPSTGVAAGKAQFGIGGSSLLLERAAGKPVVVLAVILQHSPYVIYTSQDTENIASLKGKKIMLEAPADELVAYLRKEGIPQDQIQHLPLSFDPKDLISGQADAISGHLLDKPDAFDFTHFAYRTFSPRASGIDFYGDNLFTSQKELNEHPQRVQAFLEASLHGWRYARNHREEIIDLILKKYSTHYARDYLQFQSEQTALLLQADTIPIGNSSPMRWQRIIDAFAAAGMLPKDFSVNGFLYSPLPEKPKEPDHKDEPFQYPASAFAALLSCLIALFGIYILRTNSKLKQNAEELHRMKLRELTSDHVLKLLTSDTPLADVLNAVIANVAVHDKRALCAIVLLNKDGTQLHFGAASILQNIMQSPSPGLHPCANVLQTGKPFIAANIASNPACAECREGARQAGLIACYAEPITSPTGKTVGIITIYHREPHEHSHDDIKLLTHLAHLASVAVEYCQTKQLLQQQHDLLVATKSQ